MLQPNTARIPQRRTELAPAVSHADCSACLFKPRCLPADLSGETLDHFERSVLRQPRPIKAGEVLVHQGDDMHALYFLRVGSLKAIIDESSGEEHVVGFRFPGSVIGLAEPDARQWARTFIALEDTWLCRIPLTSIDDPLRRQLVNLMSERLRAEYAYHLTLAFKSGARKLAAFFMEISDNFSARGLSAQRFHLPMSYVDVASYLGIRHESVSRILGQFKQSGLLVKQSKLIRITDLERLRQLAQE